MLLQVQTSKALGSNVWRMSHNPYLPILYDLLDEAGVLVWDENRDMGVCHSVAFQRVLMMIGAIYP